MAKIIKKATLSTLLQGGQVVSGGHGKVRGVYAPDGTEYVEVHIELDLEEIISEMPRAVFVVARIHDLIPDSYDYVDSTFSSVGEGFHVYRRILAN